MHASLVCSRAMRMDKQRAIMLIVTGMSFAHWRTGGSVCTDVRISCLCVGFVSVRFPVWTFVGARRDKFLRL